MTCKNCGAQLSDNAKVCKNCGAFIDDNSGYVLLTADDRISDFYSNPAKEKEKKKHKVRSVFIFLLIVALIGSGAYLYFTKLDAVIHKPPAVAMESGSGIIDGTDRVIYVTLDNKNIEYIHGVELVDPASSSSEPLSKDYEYTKSIDSTFRAIFFYTDSFKLEKDKKYIYYMNIKLQFKDDDRIYTYSQPVEFNGDINGDVAEIVFDHSMYGVNRID